MLDPVTGLALTYQLQKIGGNLNQLAAHANRTRAMPEAAALRGGDRAAQSDVFEDRRGMIPNIVTGSGITGALAYVMGQGNDAQTGRTA